MERNVDAAAETLSQLGYFPHRPLMRVNGTFDGKTLAAVQKSSADERFAGRIKVGLRTMNLNKTDEVKPNMVVYGEKRTLSWQRSSGSRSWVIWTGEAADGQFRSRHGHGH